MAGRQAHSRDLPRLLSASDLPRRLQIAFPALLVAAGVELDFVQQLVPPRKPVQNAFI